MIYIKEEQQYKGIKNIIDDLGWKDLADRRNDTHLTLFYKIVNHQVNVPSEYIIIVIQCGV